MPAELQILGVVKVVLLAHVSGKASASRERISFWYTLTHGRLWLAVDRVMHFLLILLQRLASH